MKRFYKDPNLAIAHNEFANGRRELVISPGYGDFRKTFLRTPQRAEEMLKASPECVLYAACMMSNVETDPDVCHQAGDMLVRAVKSGVSAAHSLHVIAGVMMTDEFSSIRAKAADIIALCAEAGNDISRAMPALEAALSDRSSEVRANARRALEAANRIS
ncbi:MAG: hypothetical protein AB1295_03980 [Candidatus Micrarchaeota archaeon]